MARAARPSERHSLTYQLREIIESRGLTAHGLGRLAGVDAGVISRFLTGQRDIRMETADRIAAALGLRLIEVGRPGRRARAAAGPTRTPRPSTTAASSPD